MPRAEYLGFGDQVALIAQLESAEAARNTAAIAAVEGVDVLLVGAADLSVSEGLSEDDLAIRELIALAVRQGREAGLPVGNAGGASAAAVQASVDAGFTFTMMSNDASLLGGAARAAVEAGRTVRF
jgi:2-keto-3-deoxy-L-rhamnonate aldolase RhmA